MMGGIPPIGFDGGALMPPPPPPPPKKLASALKCGVCHTCLKPNLKKACLTNKALKDPDVAARLAAGGGPGAAGGVKKKRAAEGGRRGGRGREGTPASCLPHPRGRPKPPHHLTPPLR